ncbi:MAG: YdcF family protein [Alphaproteobacteria bacterium]
MTRLGDRRRIPVFRLFLMAASVAFLVWAAGFYRFAQLIPEPLPGAETGTDAIIVLTGGAGRVGEGLSLLERGLGKKLFVSGVYRGVDVQELLKVARRTPGNLECCIALGYTADNTRGNARETADWIRHENITSVRIVTASYHMPRSLLEFRQVLPGEIAIVPHPVFPDGFPTRSWWREANALRLAISEYHKYLLARLEMELM